MECKHLPPPQRWDEAEPEDLKEYHLHVRFCSSCRKRVLKEAPDQLLFDLQSDPLPQDFWLGFWNSIRQKSQIRKTRIFPYHPIRWAAVFVIGFMILLYGRNLPETEPVRQIGMEAYPVVESIGNPEARYYIFQSGQQGKIVMVFDPDMEL